MENEWRLNQEREATLQLKLAYERESNLTNIGGDATVKSTDYGGRQFEWTPWFFQFKVPSEHTISGKQMDVEM